MTVSQWLTTKGPRYQGFQCLHRKRYVISQFLGGLTSLIIFAFSHITHLCLITFTSLPERKRKPKLFPHGKSHRQQKRIIRRSPIPSPTLRVQRYDIPLFLLEPIMFPLISFPTHPHRFLLFIFMFKLLNLVLRNKLNQKMPATNLKHPAHRLFFSITATTFVTMALVSC